jgi:4-amino-4-deoxy-L-arabinose transferase-like glycosyltransferase
MRDRTSRIAAVVLLVSLIVRVVYVLATPTPALVADAAGYDAASERLVRTGSFAYPLLAYNTQGRITGQKRTTFIVDAPANAYTMPGYTVFLASMRLLGGGSDYLLLTRVAQALLGTLSLMLLFLIARWAADDRTALVSLVAAALYPPFVYASGQLMTEALYTFVMLGFVAVLLRAIVKERPLLWAIAGALLGASVLIRPVILLWAAVPALYVLWTKRKTPRRAFVWLTAFALGVTVVMVPWWVRNAIVYHHFIPLTTASANPLAAATSKSYIAGGRPSADAPVPDALLKDDYALGKYWEKVAAEHIAEIVRTDPAGYARIKLHNGWYALSHFWPPTPVDGTNPMWPRRITKLMMYVVLVLGWLGLAAGWRRPTLVIVASLPLYFVGVHLATLILNRYIYPAWWLWFIPAAYAVVRAVDLARRRGTA